MSSARKRRSQTRRAWRASQLRLGEPSLALISARWSWLALCLLLAAPGARSEDNPAPAPTKPAPSDEKKSEGSKSAESKPADSEKTKKAETKEDDKADDESATAFRNWIDIGVGGVAGEGDEAQFSQRHKLPYGPFGGVEDFHYEQKVGKKTNVQLDGRALFDLHDYAVRYELVQPNVGYVRGGVKEYRTWYDAHGGFFPLTDSWASVFNNDLALDQGEAWFEAGLTQPRKPKVSFKYTYQFRDGLKSSTSWGDMDVQYPSSLIGSPINLRGIVPAYRDLDENRHIFDGEISHTLGKTDVALGLTYEMDRRDNAYVTERRPGEGPQLDAKLTQREKVDDDLFNVHASSQTRFNDRLMFTAGYSYTLLDSDYTGSRFYGDPFDVGYRTQFAAAQGFLNMSGGSELNQHVANLNLWSSPATNFVLVPSVRFERLDVDSSAAYLLTSGDSTAPIEAASERALTEVTERLEARYNGVTNWVFYARGDWSQGQGDLKENGGNGPLVSSMGIDRVTDDNRFTQKYTVGVNWYPWYRMNLDLQYYHKTRDNEYSHSVDSTPNVGPNEYPAFFKLQNFTTEDLSGRLTWRALKNLTFVTRYDFQYSTVDSTPAAPSLISGVESSLVHSHILSESVTWIPWPRLYFQGAFNYVIDRTDTPAEKYVPTAADAKNDYLTASVTGGFVVDNRTDLQAHYFYYRANDSAGNPEFTQPFGADAEEHAAVISLSRRINRHLRVSLKYGYFIFHDWASGGLNDSTAHMVFMGAHYRF
jgi:hypothetical protein